MGSTLFPADPVTPPGGGALTPAYTGRRLRQAMAAFLAGASTARPLGAKTGIRQGPVAGLVNASTTQWSISPHVGVADVALANEAGPYEYSFDTAQVGAMTPAPSSPNTRIDIVWVRLDDPAEGDGSTLPQPVAGYTAGQPGSSPQVPTPPAVTGGRSPYVVLAQLLVSSSGAPVVTIVAPFTSANGGRVLVYSQAERDALPAYNGLHVHRLDTGNVETYHGGWRTEYDATAWTDFGNSALSGEGGGSTTGGSGGGISLRYKRTPGRVIVGDFTILIGGNGMSTSPVTGVYNLLLPVKGALPWGTDRTIGTCVYYGGTDPVGAVLLRNSGAGVQAAFVFHGQQNPAQLNNPGGWGAGTRMSGNFQYEAAA